MYTNEAIESGSAAGQMYEAEIASNPIAASDDVFVRIPQFDSDVDPRGLHKHGPCRWTPRPLGGGTLDYPTNGDEALVVVGDLGNYWILAWWPYA